MTHPASAAPLPNSDLPLHLLHRGKVRDNYDLGDSILMVTTDRVSAFDVVLPAAIPAKGRVLAGLSAFWFQKTAHIVPNRLVEVVNDVRILHCSGANGLAEQAKRG